MRILALALADDHRRFVRGFPPKGARMLLNPDLEIAGLAGVAGPDDIICQDEKVELLDLSVPFDWALLSTDYWQESRIREVAFGLRGRDKPVVLFGPVATAKFHELCSVADSVVVGNILNVWPELRSDAEQGRFKPVYRALPCPAYAVPDLRRIAKPAFDPSFQCLRAVVGCYCPTAVRPFCRQYLYHQDNTLKRDLEELTGEVLGLRHKHVYLLDEDVARERDFYREFFSRVWHYKREWTVLAGERIFDDSVGASSHSYVHLLAKAGVRVMNLNESWLSQERIVRAVQNRDLARRLRNQVRLLHRQRLLVGARISLFLAPGDEFDYVASYRLIDSLSIDFLLVRTFMAQSPTSVPGSWFQVPETMNQELRTNYPVFVPYEPGLLPDKPNWWKNQFYGLDSIIRRSLRRPVRVGFYSTLRYYYPRSFAYRQNFLECVGYPP